MLNKRRRRRDYEQVGQDSSVEVEDDIDEPTKENPLDSSSYLVRLYVLITQSWLMPFIKQCYRNDFIDNNDENDYTYSLPQNDVISHLDKKWKYYMEFIQNKNNKTINCWNIIWFIEKRAVVFTCLCAAGEATLHTMVCCINMFLLFSCALN